ncbi:hypothetical protein LP420_40180 [Massilia sp. B-10]|nr:hypothetical protein LP420_40180 [Massilia sp. B-10]
MARTVHFDPTAGSVVDAAAETIDLGAYHGYSTGDEVTYRMDPGGSVVNGLTDGQKYFLRISGDKASMYDTEDHANAGGATGRVDLVAAPAATGTAHGFEESGGPTGTGVGIAVAVNVANVTNEAILGDSTITADGVVVKAMMADVGGDTENTFQRVLPPVRAAPTRAWPVRWPSMWASAAPRARSPTMPA